MTDQIKYTHRVHDKRILVIGGSSGIGFAVAECLLEHGAGAMILASSNQARVDGKVQQLQSAYPSKAARVAGFACNLADQGTLEHNVKTLLEKATDNGRHKLDHIVHTAGDVLKILPLAEIDLQTLIQAGMVRFYSAIMLCKYAAGFMNPGPASSITLTTGTVSERPLAGWSAPVGYATGLQGVCRAMALDLAPLRVLLVSPGAVQTELWDNFGLSDEQKQNVLTQHERGMPTGKVGQASDVAEAYLYAIKDQNITGTMISTNGGALLMGPQATP